MGAAVDYSLAVPAKARLDAALLVATANNDIKKTAAVAQSDALTMFNAQASACGLTVSSVSVTVTVSVSSRSATGTATITLKTYFMGLFGYATMEVSASSSAGASLPTDMDFYIVLDNSPSQGLGATTADMTALQNATLIAVPSLGFLCLRLPRHLCVELREDAAGRELLSIAKQLGIAMRVDEVRSATQLLTDTTTASELISNQFRMAVYSMGNDCSAVRLTTIASLSSVKSAVSSVDLMTIPIRTTTATCLPISTASYRRSTA